MTESQLYITSYVIVRNGFAAHNGAVVLDRPGNDVAAFTKELYKLLKVDYSKFFKMDHLCKLAIISTELLLKDRNLLADYKPDEIALVFSNSSASLDTDESYFRSVEDKSNYFPSPAVFVYTLPNIMMGEVCIRHKFLGENTFFISEKFDADLLSEYAQHIITSGKAGCAIAGWVEINDQQWEAVLFLIEKTINQEQKLSPALLESRYSNQT